MQAGERFFPPILRIREEFHFFPPQAYCIIRVHYNSAQSAAAVRYPLARELPPSSMSKQRCLLTLICKFSSPSGIRYRMGSVHTQLLPREVILLVKRTSMCSMTGVGDGDPLSPCHRPLSPPAVASQNCLPPHWLFPCPYFHSVSGIMHPPATIAQILRVPRTILSILPPVFVLMFFPPFPSPECL